MPLAELGAEFLFQVTAERAERSAALLTTNLPFSEWTQVIPNARLCKAVLDRRRSCRHCHAMYRARASSTSARSARRVSWATRDAAIEPVALAHLLPEIASFR